MAPAVLVALLAVATPPKTLAAPGLTGVDVPPEALAFFNEHVSLGLSRRGLEVKTAKQIESVVGLERQRELLGCADSSCLAEIASALGVDGMVIGEVGRFGDTYQVHLKVISSADAKLLASFSKHVGKDDVLDALDEGAGVLAAGLGYRPAAPAAQARIPAAVPIALGVVSAASIGIGAVLLAQSGSKWSQLHDSSVSLSDSAAVDVAMAGSREQTWGWVALSAGGVALAATAVIVGLRIASKPVTASAVVTPGGASMMLQVKLP